MNATAQLRRRAGQRVSSALWGVLVISAGVLMATALSGYAIDFQLAAIIVLGALGVWLLLSAAVSGIGRQKQVALATAPVVEEPVVEEPVVEEPVVEEPVVEEPVADELADDEVTDDAPLADEPTTEEPNKK